MMSSKPAVESLDKPSQEPRAHRFGSEVVKGSPITLHFWISAEDHFPLFFSALRSTLVVQ